MKKKEEEKYPGVYVTEVPKFFSTGKNPKVKGRIGPPINIRPAGPHKSIEPTRQAIRETLRQLKDEK